jgi:cytochrome b6-f complex iron-sulfur subunit
MDEREQKHRSPDRPRGLTRRLLFERLGWLGVGLVGLGSIPATIRFLKPGWLSSAGGAFDAGTVGDYGDIVVSTRWLRQHRVWVVRRRGELYVLEARCPHLGCTPRWEPHTRLFRCPCHGSQFSLEGMALNGPAKDPLKRAAIWRDGERILIDPGRLADMEDAEHSEPFVVRL